MLFWLIVGALAAAAALAVSARAAAESRRAAAGAQDPTVAVLGRQLGELDDLHRRGLLGDAELDAARAEAGRRLLSAADRAATPERPGGRGTRTVVTAAAAAAVLLALGLYARLGRPGVADQPYRERLRTWTRQDPSALGPAELAAVLRPLARTRPDDPKVFEFLGRAELAAGDPGGAATAFARAARLAPADADYPAAAGEALMAGASDGKVSPEAEAQFREALRRDPRNPAARYHLAKLAIAQGDEGGGRTALNALLADLPADDPRRADLRAEIAASQASPRPLSGGPSAAQVAAAAEAVPAGEQAAFIRGMVDRLAQRLASKPDDVDGWARLVRAYGVLGDGRARADALTRARTVFARRPADLARIEAEAGAPPGSPR